METRKRWQLFLIVLVLSLTLYNILPTIFFYSKPLDAPISSKGAHTVSTQIAKRIDRLEDDTITWLTAFSKNLGVKPQSIALVENDPKLVKVTLKNNQDARLFKTYLSRAGALIPFAPAQLTLLPEAPGQEPSNTVIVQRRIGTVIAKDQLGEFFHFSEKFEPSGEPTPFYQEIVFNRAARIGEATGGVSRPALLSLAALRAPDATADGPYVALAQDIVDYARTFSVESPLTRRFYASTTQTREADGSALIQALQQRLQKVEDNLAARIDQTKSQPIPEAARQQSIRAYEKQQSVVQEAISLIQEHTALFTAGTAPLTAEEALSALEGQEVTTQQTLGIGNNNPFIAQITIDWESEQILLRLHEELEAARTSEQVTENQAFVVERLNQLIMNEIARIGQVSDEKLSPTVSEFAAKLSELGDSKSFLSLNLGAVAEQRATSLLHRLEDNWLPTHPDLTRRTFPILDWKAYQQLPPDQRQLGLIVYAPSTEAGRPERAFRMSSIYVIARGMSQIVEKVKSLQGEEDQGLREDLQSLIMALEQSGFVGYAATSYGLPKEYENDYVFEFDSYYSDLLAATRENFTVPGNKRYAILEFSDLKQRILTINAIETAMHEDLLKWRDEYKAARVDLNLAARYDVPPPTRNILWDNMKLSFAKYFRGDERKVLKWGLDLSGGKTVTLGLVDQNLKPVTAEADLRQGVNELYNRVNKMGVSEVEIRIEGNHIVLNFPGAQGLSASELVKASTMTFNIVNEEFGPRNANLAAASGRFLQEVWNEAVVTGQRDIQSINEIAWRHLGGSVDEEGLSRPISEDARVLYENGLRLANPTEDAASSIFSETLSSISMWRGDSFADWQGQPNPLLIVFHNYALEGVSLENVHSEYDPSKGHILVFGVKRAVTSQDGIQTNPRADFAAWTGAFAKEKVVGTPKELYSGGEGWRMAAILNGQVVSAPVLLSPLRESAIVQGHFSQREVNQLAADLKAGSLSFTPKVLSETNVSPELGHEERSHGILAAFIGLVAVILLMSWYYRFGGLVAGCAVVLNLLIMWGVLQNLDAALTLPGIAGIILTMGMAVDANVLVFERIREEFSHSGRIVSAVQTGYRKAFSAIVDSNVTTIIAALILLNFDAGPIKGFAITLIIGILSSMFTALFMTRYFFSRWVQNSKHKELKMRNLFKSPQLNFLGKAKMAAAISIAVIVIGGALVGYQRNTLFGMDFTGGYSLTVDLEEKAGVDYRTAAYAALTEAGVPRGQAQVRELNRPNHLRLQLDVGLEQMGLPFYGLPKDIPADEVTYPYQTNPRISWVVNALEAGGLTVQPRSLLYLQDQWNVMSGQFSDNMRNQAIMGLGLALLAILVYITIRFEFKFAISAIIALAHDLLVTVGALAILHILGVGVQVDLQVVGALMTIIGYSLNDTIVIFDRIREDGRVLRKLSYGELINHSLNVTLNRTLMTSGTTLVVLLALLILGGSAIFDFALVMTMGVVFGTFSSLFIASPTLLFFHKREEARAAATKA